MKQHLASALLLACVVTAAGCAGQPSSGSSGGTGNGGDGDGDGSGGGTGSGDTGSGSGSDGTGGGDTMSATDFLAAMDDSYCDSAFTCKASFPTADGSFADAFGASASACYADAADYENAPAVEAAIAGGTIMFDGAAAAACVAGLTQTTTTACATFWSDGPDYPAACDGVMAGTIADGAACTVDYECENPDSICDSRCTADTGGDN